MKKNRTLYFLVLMMSMLGSKTNADLKIDSTNKEITNLKQEKLTDKQVQRNKSADKSNIKKKKDVKNNSDSKKTPQKSFYDKSMPIIKKVVPHVATLLLGAMLHHGYQNFFSENEKFHYTDGFIELPDEMYNDNGHYIPNSSGLSNYNGDQYNNEYHLKWSQNNCWVLSNLYLYFRPELKSTYESYASKSIKEIISDLDNLDNSMNHLCKVFFNGHQNFLDNLKQDVKNSNFDKIFDYFSLIKDKESKEKWDRVPDKNKADALISFYNYQTLYRFHYAVSIKNRCRIYTKMINNPNKMVNIYEMNDLCKEGDSIPDWWLSGKGIYKKIFKILGQKYKGLQNGDDYLHYFSSMLEYTNPYNNNTSGSGHGEEHILYNLHNSESFNFKPEKNELVWNFSLCNSGHSFSNEDDLIELLNNQYANVDHSNVNSDEKKDEFLKHGMKNNNDNSKSYVTSIEIDKNNHAQIIRLKYDDNLKCTHLVDKQCYQDSDNVVAVPNEYKNNLFEFIFKHIKNLDSNFGITAVHFVKENELRNNLNYYKFE